MSDKHYCRCCGAELVICDECHGEGRVQVDGPMDPETGQVGYSENCGECSGRGGYAAPQQMTVSKEVRDAAYDCMRELEKNFAKIGLESESVKRLQIALTSYDAAVKKP